MFINLSKKSAPPCISAKSKPDAAEYSEPTTSQAGVALPHSDAHDLPAVVEDALDAGPDQDPAARPLHGGNHAERKLGGAADGVESAALGVVHVDQPVEVEAGLRGHHAEVSPHVAHYLTATGRVVYLSRLCAMYASLRGAMVKVARSQEKSINGKPTTHRRS